MEIFAILTHRPQKLTVRYTPVPLKLDPAPSDTFLFITAHTPRAFLKDLQQINTLLTSLGHSVRHVYGWSSARGSTINWYDFQCAIAYKWWIDLENLAAKSKGVKDHATFANILWKCQGEEINLPPNLPPVT